MRSLVRVEIRGMRGVLDGGMEGITSGRISRSTGELKAALADELERR